MEWQKNEFVVSDDYKRLNIDMIHQYLSRSYWGQGRSKEIVQQSIQNSFSLGLFHNQEQVGFLRVITDYATFAYLCDVFILEQYQKQELGHFLLDCLFQHPKVAKLKFLLKTRDAHSLYRDFQFQELTELNKWMIHS